MGVLIIIAGQIDENKNLYPRRRFKEGWNANALQHAYGYPVSLFIHLHIDGILALVTYQCVNNLSKFSPSLPR